MISYLVMITLYCAEPVIYNYEGTWEKIDDETYERATLRCTQLYMDAPCLKVFIKKREREYSAICGYPKD